MFHLVESSSQFLVFRLRKPLPRLANRYFSICKQAILLHHKTQNVSLCVIWAARRVTLGISEALCVLQSVVEEVFFKFFEEDENVRRGKAEKYQEHTAMWISGTPQSSAGPCSQTPWCSPRLLDNPEKTKRETLLFHLTHHLQAWGSWKWFKTESENVKDVQRKTNLHSLQPELNYVSSVVIKSCAILGQYKSFIFQALSSLKIKTFDWEIFFFFLHHKKLKSRFSKGKAFLFFNLKCFE